MNNAADRYRKLSDRFADLLAAVPDDRWDAPSPCTGWTTLGVARHVVEVHGMFEKLAGRPIEVPDADDGPLDAFRQVQRIVQDDLDDPDRASTGWDGFFGRTTFAEAVDRFVCFDLIVHGWDLARAAGIDDTMPADEFDRLDADIAYFGDSLSGAGATAPPVHVDGGADRQTRLLAAVGRHADWPVADRPGNAAS